MKHYDVLTLLSLRKKLQQLNADLTLEEINGSPHIVLKVDDAPQEQNAPEAVTEDSSD